MKERALILLEGHRTVGPLYIKAAQSLGIHPITLATNPTQFDYLAAKGLEAARVDTDDLGSLVRECCRLHSTYDIAGITGFSGLDESIYVTVGKLCRHFDLPGPDPASIERCCDKFVQRQLLAAAGIPMPAYRLVADATEVESSAAEIGLPVIVKPAVGSGSCGVRLCRSIGEVADHTAYLLAKEPTRGASPRILIEEFAQGPQYSADTMGTEVIAVGAADFDCSPQFVVRGSIFPAPLTDFEHERIANVSLSCLRALDLGWGPANIEFRWTKRGPVVIEVNPRLPGWTTPRLIQLAYGIDPIAEHLKLVIGEEWDLRTKHSQTAAARFLVPAADGVLDWIEGDSLAVGLPGVTEVKLYVEPNTVIVRKGDFRDTMGHVMAASPTHAETEAILQRAVDLISWSITPLPTVLKAKRFAAPRVLANRAGS
ncbi:ATP-grasp domain-containing protein [Mesorhizobium sp. J8]|uniref:ATP-grasp domain-containing protein n=1 Tax=Mesorhizobium sp. J8 TaxID=2777475 RepID=UPI0019150E77|nr:acetyl-CoA carboxylase biotin carboxylase subunit family protein [Mesorhizobium sp. J8]BCM17648.1 ATP-grasp domain-containing protein [Mesorhizobium sp. J8]